MYSLHFPPRELTNFLNEVDNVLILRSTMPCVRAIMLDPMYCLIPSCFASMVSSFEVNPAPLSCRMALGYECEANTLSINALAVSSAVVVLTGMSSVHNENASTQTNMYFGPKVFPSL